VSPRPRTQTDEAILAAAWRVVQKHGPTQFTLARVAREAKLAPATLVQRFGSKRKLLLLLVGMSRGETERWIAETRQRIASPLALLEAFFDCFAGMATTPKEMANQLAFLQIDITDPAFHRIALEQGRVNEAAVRGLLDEAVAARQLRPTDTGRLARMLMNLCGGSLTSWAIFREGSASAWLRADLAAALDPYRRGGRAAS
jgi:AcrR family transcriptional regulator